MGLERVLLRLLLATLVRRNLGSGGGGGWNFSARLGLHEMVGFEGNLLLLIVREEIREGEMLKNLGFQFLLFLLSVVA